LPAPSFLSRSLLLLAAAVDVAVAALLSSKSNEIKARRRERAPQESTASKLSLSMKQSPS
jgi:hypothetical protein